MKHQSNKTSSAIFLIGLGLLFVTGWWFPGIFFVIGASSIAQAMDDGKRWYATQGGMFMVGLGTIFWLGLNPAAIVLVIGAMMLLGIWDNDGNPLTGEKKKKSSDII